MNQDIMAELTTILGEANVRKDEPMCRHTTFKIGGNADYFVTPETTEQIHKLVQYLNKESVPFYIVGNGSNLLVSDQGFRGVIIQLFQKFSGFKMLSEDDLADLIGKKDFIDQHGLEAQTDDADQQEVRYVKAQAGVMLSRLGNELAGWNLEGFEFATGIPGTLGGAVRMNAGAYGGEIKDVLVNATVMNVTGEVFTLTNSELKLAYRTSVVDDNQYIVLEAVLALRVGNHTEIMDKIRDFSARRRDKQPLEYPSAGSTFKRPEGYFAGKLISDAGLKGFQVGGAQVSEKHAGFVINTGNATAQDVIDLTDQVKQKILEKDHVTLELEVKKLGF